MPTKAFVNNVEYIFGSALSSEALTAHGLNYPRTMEGLGLLPRYYTHGEHSAPRSYTLGEADFFPIGAPLSGAWYAATYYLWAVEDRLKQTLKHTFTRLPMEKSDWDWAKAHHSEQPETSKSLYLRNLVSKLGVFGPVPYVANLTGPWGWSDKDPFSYPLCELASARGSHDFFRHQAKVWWKHRILGSRS